MFYSYVTFLLKILSIFKSLFKCLKMKLWQVVSKLNVLYCECFRNYSSLFVEFCPINLD